MDQPSTSNGVEPVPVQADGEKTEVGKGQTKGIAGNPTPVYEEVEIDPNDGCDLVGEVRREYKTEPIHFSINLAVPICGHSPNLIILHLIQSQ